MTLSHVSLHGAEPEFLNLARESLQHSVVERYEPPHISPPKPVDGIFVFHSGFCASLVMENPEMKMLNEMFYLLKHLRWDQLSDGQKCYRAPAEACPL